MCFLAAQFSAAAPWPPHPITRIKKLSLKKDVNYPGSHSRSGLEKKKKKAGRWVFIGTQELRLNSELGGTSFYQVPCLQKRTSA